MSLFSGWTVVSYVRNGVTNAAIIVPGDHAG
jgi:hypothetical protein